PQVVAQGRRVRPSAGGARAAPGLRRRRHPAEGRAGGRHRLPYRPRKLVLPPAGRGAEPVPLEHHRPRAQRPRAHLQMNHDTSADILSRLAETLESRLPARGGDPAASYSAKLLARGPDAFLKKIGEEATELVMAAKDNTPERIVAETADLWFHCMVALAHYGLRPEQVLAELARREGVSGLTEKASRSES